MVLQMKREGIRHAHKTASIACSKPKGLIKLASNHQQAVQDRVASQQELLGQQGICGACYPAMGALVQLRQTTQTYRRYATVKS
jgi:hypothetical protein